MCVHLVLCMSSAGVHGDQKHWMPLKVELRVAVRHLMWVVGTELSPLEEQRSLLSSEPFPLSLLLTLSTTRCTCVTSVS